MNKRVVIALGGNAIQKGNGATAEDQQRACYQTAEQLSELIEGGYELIISHGNGPQVGNVVLQQQLSQSEKLPAMPLDTCGAMSQGMIGYWLQTALIEVFKNRGIDKEVLTAITEVMVDEADSAFENPTKPIGSFYSEEEAKELIKTKGYVMKEDAGRGWRRVVPSPMPVNIVGIGAIIKLIESEVVLIAAGGGGIPVYSKDGKLKGIEAVIDKDFASEKLAELVDADTLLILTAVEHVSLHYGQQNEQKLRAMTVNEAKQFIKEGHFAPGSMLPKIEAAIMFVQSKPGRKALITSLEKASKALRGETGTLIVRSDEFVPIHRTGNEFVAQGERTAVY